MVKIPRVKETGRPLRRLSLKEFRQKLTQPYIHAPKDETPEAEKAIPEPAVLEMTENSEAAVPEMVEPMTDLPSDPEDTSKKRNLGFIFGCALMAVLILAAMVYEIIITVMNYNGMSY